MMAFKERSLRALSKKDETEESMEGALDATMSSTCMEVRRERRQEERRQRAPIRVDTVDVWTGQIAGREEEGGSSRNPHWRERSQGDQETIIMTNKT